ncbi:MAG: FAD-binding oxidoreductase, partial [bacterium]
MKLKSLNVQTKNGSNKSLSGEVAQELRKRLKGELLTPEDGGYDASRAVWNGIIQSKPGVIAKCAGVDDVKTAVNFCRDHELLVSVRSGGHNVAGTAVRDGSFVIDVSNMRDVRVDPEGRMARVEGGARLGDVDKATQQFNLAAPIGVVSRTGVAGLTLHGGAGWLLRTYGLSIDNVAHFEIVTADGELRRVGEALHPDLFWALRGGGGNFGVVTSFDFRLHPVGPKVWFSVPLYPLERSADVMTFLRDYIAEAPEDLMAIGVYWS